MRLRVGQRQRLGLLGDQADEAFARAHGGEVDRLAVQTFGGVELELAVGAQHVDRADFGDHVGGDVDDDAVEARLRAHRLRHDLAKPAQQQTRSAQTAAHHIVLSWNAPINALLITFLTRISKTARRALANMQGDSCVAFSATNKDAEVRTARVRTSSGLVETVERMQRAHRQFGVGGVDQHGKFDLARS